MLNYKCGPREILTLSITTWRKHLAESSRNP